MRSGKITEDHNNFEKVELPLLEPRDVYDSSITRKFQLIKNQN